MNFAQRILFIFCLMLTTSALIAQIGVGFRAGITLPDQKYETSGFDISGSSYMGLTAAVLFEIGISEMFAVQPEIAFIQKGTKSEFDFGGTTLESKTRINHIDVPILAKARFGNESIGAYVAAGPTFGYAVSGFYEEDGEKTDIKDDDWDGYNRFEIGASAGAGIGKKLTSGQVFLDFRYIFSLSNLADEDDVTAHNMGMNISIGYLANLTK